MYVICTPKGVIYGPYPTYEDAMNTISAHATPETEYFWTTCQVRICTPMPAPVNA